MGVPSFFRWLTTRYPKIRSRRDANPLSPNDYDNLYVDMNGIIHTAAHSGEGNVYAFNEDQVILRMFQYLDRMFELTQPNKLVYLAVDGVAPRAKINQQRARRYESARSRRKVLEDDEDLVDVECNEDVESEMAQLKQTLDLGIFGIDRENSAPVEAASSVVSGGLFGGDDNSDRVVELNRERSMEKELAKEGDDAVTVGSTLSEAFSFVCEDQPHDLLNPAINDEDPLGWDRNSISPGTPLMMKIGQAIKQYVYDKINNDPRWKKLLVIVSDTNTYGEGEHKMVEYIRALRCQPDYDPKTKHLLVGMDADLVFLSLALHEPYCDILRERRGSGNTASPPDKVKFDVVNINTVRQYMEAEYKSIQCNWTEELDIENVIDDFVLLCFFGGNDFMPSLPTCFVDMHGLDHIFQIYHMLLPTLGSYLTKQSTINWRTFGRVIEKYALMEDAIFQGEADASRESGKIQALTGDSKTTVEQWSKVYYDSICVNPSQIDEICEAYLRTLSWVLQYYFSNPMHTGSPDIPPLPFGEEVINQHFNSSHWAWFYPYHYTPLVHDLARFLKMPTATSAIESYKGATTQPFSTITQLLAVLPPDSSPLIPGCLRVLVEDRQSVISDFYPDTYIIDMNGKQEDYKAIVRLPFIEEERLVNVVQDHFSLLTDEEKMCNLSRPTAQLFMHVDHPMAVSCNAVQKPDMTTLAFNDVRTSTQCHGLIAKVFNEADGTPLGATRHSIVKGCEDVCDNQVIVVDYCLPVITADQNKSIHKINPKLPKETNKFIPARPHPLALTTFGRWYVAMILLPYITIVIMELFRSAPLRDSWRESFDFLFHVTALAIFQIVFGLLWTVDASLASVAANKRIERRSRGKRVNTKRDSNNTKHYEPQGCFVDWVCPKCPVRNFERNEVCFKCNAPKPEQPLQVYKPKKAACNAPQIVLDHGLHLKVCRGKMHVKKSQVSTVQVPENPDVVVPVGIYS